jgi:hypothetical protein
MLIIRREFSDSSARLWEQAYINREKLYVATDPDLSYRVPGRTTVSIGEPDTWFARTPAG